MRRAAPVVLALVSVACGSDHTRYCDENSDCLQGGVSGFCTPSPYSVSKFCAYPDDTCDGSHLRWGVLAGDGLAAMCLDPRLASDAGADGPLPDGGLGIADAMSPDVPDHPPVTNFQAADLVLGQPNFTSQTANNGGQSPGSLSAPLGLSSDGTRLLVADPGNLRVLQWNSPPITTNAYADALYGQSGFGASVAGPTQSLLVEASDVRIAGGRVFIADGAGNRVLVFAPVVGAGPSGGASLVLGQPDFTSKQASGGATGMNHAGAVWSDGNLLVVADTSNHRVLVWHAVPTVNGAAADTVLGQPDFASVAAPDAPTASSLRYPAGVFFDGQRLFVADAGNNRILAWNALPSAGENGKPADFVIGQGGFESNSTNAGGGLTSSPAGLWDPSGVTVGHGSLFVADAGNRRVVVYTPVPTASGPTASAVLGQPDPSTTVPYSGVVAPNKFARPRRVLVLGSWLFVADGQWNRVTRFTLAL